MRYTQPQQGPAGIDWASPLARGLVFATLPPLGSLDLASGLIGVVESTNVTRAPGAAGVGYQFTGSQTTGVVWPGWQRQIGLTRVTVGFTLLARSIANSPKPFGKWGANHTFLTQIQADGSLIIGLRGNVGTDLVVTGGGVVQAGVLANVSWSWDGGAQQYRCFVNGINRPLTTFSGVVAANTALVSSTDALRIGIADDGGPLDGQVFEAFVSGQPWSNADHVSNAQNPWAKYAAPRIVLRSVAASTSHNVSGALAAAPATVSGAANRFAVHSVSGALAAGTAVISGTANRVVTHSVSGALAAGLATVSGSALRSAAHAVSGALVAGPATVSGAASRNSALASHSLSGALAASSAVVTGSARRFITHNLSGALIADPATVSGTASRDAAPLSGGSANTLLAWYFMTRLRCGS